MVYAIVSLALAFLGTLTWMMIWVGRLKDDHRQAEKDASQWEQKSRELAEEISAARGTQKQLEKQLAALREEFDDLVKDIEDGSYSGVDRIIELFGRGL